MKVKSQNEIFKALEGKANIDGGRVYSEVKSITVDTPYGKPITGIADGKTFTLNSHGFSDGDLVELYYVNSLVFLQNITYYIRNVTTNTFELSATSNGAILVDNSLNISGVYICALPSSSETTVTMKAHSFALNDVIEITAGRGTKPPSITLLSATSMNSNGGARFEPLISKYIAYVYAPTADTFQLVAYYGATTPKTLGTATANGWRIRAGGVKSFNILGLDFIADGGYHQLQINGATAKGTNTQNQVYFSCNGLSEKKYFSTGTQTGIGLNSTAYYISANSFSTRYFTIYEAIVEIKKINGNYISVMQNVVEVQGTDFNNMYSGASSIVGGGLINGYSNITSINLVSPSTFLNGTQISIRRVINFANDL